jgi:hypothetical protein
MQDSDWNKQVDEIYSGLTTEELNEEMSNLHYEINNKFNAVDALKNAGAIDLANQVRSYTIAMTKRSKRINAILESRKNEQ